jgi:hypothetical protein
VRIPEAEKADVGGVDKADWVQDGIILGVEMVQKALCTNRYHVVDAEVRVDGVWGAPIKQALGQGGAHVVHDVLASKVVGVSG